jgi:molecular chaperone GrpE (heat shock protein)
MDAVELTSGNKNKVLEVIRKGYYFKKKLARPVSVKVGKGQDKPEPEKGEK